MWSGVCWNFSRDEVLSDAQYVYRRAGVTVGAIIDRVGRQANTTSETEDMLRLQCLPVYDDDQCNEPLLAGSLHTKVTDQPVAQALYSQLVKKPLGLDILSVATIHRLWECDKGGILCLAKVTLRT